jgi:hypothetical protein
MTLVRAGVNWRAILTLLAVLGACAIGVGAAPALAVEAGPSSAWWQLNTSSTPTHLAPGGEGMISATASNLGDAEVKASVAHPVTITLRLPAGVTVGGTLTKGTCTGNVEKTYCARKWPKIESFLEPECTSTTSTVTCTFTETLAPYVEWELDVQVKVAASVTPGSTSEISEVEVSGGELATKTLSRALRIDSSPTPFGIETYALSPENETGEPEAQGGAHPFQFTTSVAFNRIFYKFASGFTEPSVPDLARELHVNLPPGLIGNTLALPQCSDHDFTTVKSNNSANFCPQNTAIGAALVQLNEPLNAHALTVTVPVFNLVPAKGEPARFGFTATLGVSVTLDTVVRGGDYHVVVAVNNITQEPALLSSAVTIWGVPGDPRHAQSRGSACVARGADALKGEACEPVEEEHPSPFLTLPTSCLGPLQTSVEARSWLPGASFVAPLSPVSPESLQNCAALPFTPAMTITPTEHQSNTPTGLEVNLKVPQTTTLEEKGLAEANIRNTTVTLPEGVQLNPSAANGLQACSLGQVGFTGSNPLSGTFEFTSNPATCPDASKVGTVSIKTPVIAHELVGNVFLAAENENPFGSLFGLYIVVEDPISGALVKLAGRVDLDQTTGRITTTFPNAPQLPFEELSLKLDNGPRANVATPRSCGTFSSQTSFTPWSTNQAVNQSLNPQEFAVTSGPHGTPCASPQPFGPGFQAGTTNNQAGAFTPFTLTLTRSDTDQALKGISMTLPPGLAGLLSTVVQCPEPQANQGTCGEASLIGHATAVAGLGSDPFTVTGGRVYITGPYHGAPFGLSIVLPAVAGPFNFGNVVTRSTISVDPTTAALTISSELPTMLNTTTYHTGVPVQLRRVDVTVERPGGAPFQFNPTNCTPMKISGTLTGDQGASSPVSEPFAVANCDKLPFAPKLTAATSAQASKANGEALNVDVESPGIGQANIAKVFLTLPKILPSRLSTIQQACIAATFAANPATCPAGSLIGKATIHTPVLTSPLSGPAYLVSHGGAAFPDVEFVLQGEGITLILDGKTDIKNGITYSRFESAPDAPFTRFETELPAGPHSALTAFVPTSDNYNVCKSAASLVMPTEITGQNGDVIKQSTKIAVAGCKTVKAPTRAQLLAKALKACKKKKGKAKRVACEKQARKKYGPKKVAKKKKKK